MTPTTDVRSSWSDVHHYSPDLYDFYSYDYNTVNGSLSAHGYSPNDFDNSPTHYLAYDLGGSSLPMKSFYMHQGGSITAEEVTVYLSDSSPSRTAPSSSYKCYTGGFEGIGICEGTGQWLTIYNSGAGDFDLYELFVWNEESVVVYDESRTFQYNIKQSGLTVDSDSNLARLFGTTDVDEKYDCISFGYTHATH